MQGVGDLEPLDGELGRLYDAIENPRAGRSELPILRGTELRAYMDEVRGWPATAWHLMQTAFHV